MHAEQSPRTMVLVAGNVVEGLAIRRDPSPFQAALREAKMRHGSAKCLCSRPELDLVVRDLRGKLFLAAWPNDADRHAVDCPFFTDASSGATRYGPQAIVTDGNRTQVAMDRPLVVVTDSAARAVRVAGPGRDHLGLWGLLHYLWDAAGLNRWYPGWTRDWGLVRFVVRRAAQSTDVAGRALLESLYVPPVWSADKKESIRQHWRDFCDPLRRDTRGSDRTVAGVVIGMVRSISENEGRMELRLVHHGEPLLVDRRAAENMARSSRRGWNAAKRLEPEGPAAERPQVVALLRVEATRTGRILVVDGVLMRVSQRFIPVNNAQEDRIALQLVESDREFTRPLHYDDRSTPLPSFVLRDALVPHLGHPQRIAMHIYGASLGAAQRASLRARDQATAARNGFGFWEWHATSHGFAPPPPLPPRVHVPRNKPSSQPQYQKASS